MSLSLGEIRCLQELKAKKNVSFSGVSAKDKKHYASLYKKGKIAKTGTTWSIIKEAL